MLKFLMTTTFYPPYHVGGDAVHVKSLADELAKQGHEVHVMFSLDAYELKRGRVAYTDASDGMVHLHPLRSPGRWLEVLKAYTRGRSAYFSGEFERLLEEISPHVVHHHNISLLGYDLLRKRGRYLNIYTAHDYWLVCQRNDLFRDDRICKDGLCWVCALRTRRPPQGWRNSGAFASAVSDIDIAIAPSKFVCRLLAERIGLDMVHIPNFAPLPPTDIAPSGFNDYFLYAGVLERHKGILELVRLFRDQSREIGSRLVVAGTGSLEARLRACVREGGAGSKVTILGWCEHDTLYSLFAGAHALVMPSLWAENNPLVALEALSVGTPVLTSSRGGLPEIADLQGPGFVFEMGHLKEALMMVRDATPDRLRIQNIYRANFSPQRFMSSYMDLIAEKSGARH